MSTQQTEIVPAPTGGTVTAAPPIARRVSRVHVYHDDRLDDDYFWLRDKAAPEVTAYLQAENAYTDAMMAPTQSLQETLYQEMLSHIKQTDSEVPYPKDGYLYYTRTEDGKQYPIFCRKKGSLDVPEEITLDLNELAAGQSFLSLGAYQVSDNGRFLAYTLDVTGFREYTLYIKDLQTGELLPDRREKVGSVAWAADNTTLFYSTEDHAKRPYRIHRHRLGDTEDALIYEEPDEMFRVWVSRSCSRAYLFLGVSSHTADEVRYLPSHTSEGDWLLIAAREPKHEYSVEHHGDRFYIRTNSGGINFRLVTTPVDAPERANWQEIVPHRPDVMLEGVLCFANHYVLMEREQGVPQLRVTDLRTGEAHRIALPEPAYTVYPTDNGEWDTPRLRYSYQSMVTPRSVFDYDMERRTATRLKQTEVPGGFDPAHYVAERLYATAPDGVQVPISLVYRKGFERNGAAPLYLSAYGSYGASTSVAFSSNRLSLLDRGVVVALAHIRGGGEMGKAWHDAGRMLQKRNTFTDFIAAAEHLLAEGYGAKERLVIEGGSAGGLLMGAVTNMRPDLFRAVISKVPFVDVINTMMDAGLPLTVGEYEEWGNPNHKPEYDYMKTYCPYTNLERKAYPAILVKTSFNDSQVMYWEPAKYVARLRTLKTDPNPLLLKTNMAAGHGGASGRYDYLHEVAFDYAFLLWQMGIA